MQRWLRKLRPVLKALFALAILAAIAWHFGRDLRDPRLWERSFHVRAPWLILSGVLYLFGFGISTVFWYRVLWSMGQQPSFPTALRAYFIGQMGKYLPGKAWALFLRASLIQGPRVSMLIALITSLYEVLMTMSSGALLALLLIPVLLPDNPATAGWPILHHIIYDRTLGGIELDRHSLIVVAACLLFLVGAPTLFYNRLIRRVASLRAAIKRYDLDETNVPRIPYSTIPLGLALIAICWFAWGASLWAVFEAILETPESFNPATIGRYTAYLGIAYVGGFLVLPIPSGLGVREYLLTLCLMPELTSIVGPDEDEARKLALLAALVLRVVWTAAEIVANAILYWLPGPGIRSVERITSDMPPETPS
jgi:glycosyltransferase 2 family protein